MFTHRIVTRTFASRKPGHIISLIALALFLALTASSSLAQDAGVLTWQQLSTLRNLPPRAEFASAYDPVSKLTVIFGGNYQGNLLDETWVFDGTGWSHLVPRSIPRPAQPAPWATPQNAQSRPLRRIFRFRHLERHLAV